MSKKAAKEKKRMQAAFTAAAMNAAHRKNQRNMRFSVLHFGKTKTNAHIHMLCKSDTRLSANTYRELLTLLKTVN